jgi:uncharacterized protein YkwD
MRPRFFSKRTQLGLESLEHRIVPTTASLTNGVLTVLGAPASGTIQITESSGQIAVSEVSGTFAASQVKMITVDPGDGNVSVNVSSAVTAECWLFTGFGNDSIHGGGGKNHIFGGMGNDTLVGGSANDIIFAGTGHTTITAPPGAQVYNGPPYQTATISAIGQQIVDMVNQQRRAAGLAPLTVSPQLVAAAQMQSNNMASMEPILGENGAMSHELMGVPEPTLTSREEAVGYYYTAAGENIAYGYPDASSVMQAWMNSAGHRANILNSSFTQIGVAVAYAPGGVPYYTQEFGAPASNSPTGPPSLQNPPTGSAPTPPVKNPPAPPSQTPPSQNPPAPPLPPTTSGYGGGSNYNGQIYAVGSNAGTQATVTVYDAATGAVKFTLNPYGSFGGGARVAVGDLAGNGVPDVIVAPGPGMSPEIKVYNGNTGQLVEDFMAYDSGFTGGVYVAAGDLKGAGHDDIITGADAGGGPNVRAFDGTTQHLLYSFFAYDPNFTGGVRVAAGDVSGHGYDDIITGAGPGGGPDVAVFDGISGARIGNFFAYDPNFTGGVYVAAGNVKSNGRASIITGAGAGGGPNVKVFDGVSFAVLANFMAGDPNFTGGVRVGSFGSSTSGSTNIMLAFGGGQPQVELLNGSGDLLTSFLAGDSNNNNGLYVS